MSKPAATVTISAEELAGLRKSLKDLKDTFSEKVAKKNQKIKSLQEELKKATETSSGKAPEGEDTPSIVVQGPGGTRTRGASFSTQTPPSTLKRAEAAGTPARGSGDLEVVVLRDKISSLLQVLKEYEVESSAGDAKIKELSEKHKSQRAKMKPGENNLEEEFRMKSEECLVIQEKLGAEEALWAQVDAVLKDKAVANRAQKTVTASAAQSTGVATSIRGGPAAAPISIAGVAAAAAASGFSKAIESLSSIITQLRLNKVRAASLAGIPSFFDQSRAFADALKVNSTALSIDFAGIAIRDEDATLFAEALKSSQVATINFSKCSLSDKAIESISRELLGVSSSPIQNLNLASNNFSQHGAQALGAALKINKSLVSIDVSHNRLGKSALPILQAFAENQTIRQLSFSANRIGDAGAKSISEALQANSGLTSVDLTENEITEEGARELAGGMRNNKSLLTLVLSRNPVGDAGATALAFGLTSKGPKVAELSLIGTGMGEEGAAAFASYLRRTASLTTLDLWGNRLGANGAASIAAAVAQNKALKSLKLKGVALGKEGAVAVADALLANSSLTDLDLSGNFLEFSGAESLGKGLENNSALQSLNVGGNSLGNRGVVALVEKLQKAAISSLNLQLNVVGDEGLAALCKVLPKCPNVATLDLSWNHVSAPGLKALAELIRDNRTITGVTLEGNGTGPEGIVYLGDALSTNSTLTFLNLAGNNIRLEGAKALAQSLKRNSTLSSAVLRRNAVGDEGATLIADALKRNTALLTLSLEDNKIGDKGATQIADMLNINATLTAIELANNSWGAAGLAQLEAAVAKNGRVRLFV